MDALDRPAFENVVPETIRVAHDFELGMKILGARIVESYVRDFGRTSVVVLTHNRRKLTVSFFQGQIAQITERGNADLRITTLEEIIDLLGLNWASGNRPTPSTIIGRLLRALGLTQGSDFIVRGDYANGERRCTYVSIRGRAAEEMIAPHAELINRVTVVAGYPFGAYQANLDGAFPFMVISNGWETHRVVQRLRAEKNEESGVTAVLAQQALEAVKAQFKDYLDEGLKGPELIRDWEAPSGRVVDWVISWDEDAPYEWTLHAGTGEGTVSQALIGTAVWPAELYAEPYTASVLSLSIA